MVGKDTNPAIEVYGIAVNPELLGIFIALTPMTAYVIQTFSLGIWHGIYGVWMSYLIVRLLHPPETV